MIEGREKRLGKKDVITSRRNGGEELVIDRKVSNVTMKLSNTLYMWAHNKKKISRGEHI